MKTIIFKLAEKMSKLNDRTLDLICSAGFYTIGGLLVFTFIKVVILIIQTL